MSSEWRVLGKKDDLSDFLATMLTFGLYALLPGDTWIVQNKETDEIKYVFANSEEEVGEKNAAGDFQDIE
jgi:hypothetical protein